MEIEPETLNQLVSSWESQQNSHIRFRETRFGIMLDIAEQAFGGDFKSLDVACGPGSLSRRLLDRFPESRVNSVDFDPVLLAIGRNSMSAYGDRVSWIEGDLRKNDWPGELTPGPFDCAMSTTALHWLSADSLRNLYRNIYSVLKEGGIFMNGDHMILEERVDRVHDLVHKANERWSKRSFAENKAPNWEQWWSKIRDKEKFNGLLEERARRYSNPDNHNQMVSLNRHIDYLKQAGFRFIDVVWQYSNDRILVAVK